jgi:hypothetical protein
MRFFPLTLVFVSFRLRLLFRLPLLDLFLLSGGFLFLFLGLPFPPLFPLGGVGVLTGGISLVLSGFCRGDAIRLYFSFLPLAGILVVGVGVGDGRTSLPALA